MSRSKSKRVKAEMLSGMLRPAKKPDRDNIVKIICDALNELAYKDDAKIVTTQIAKYYAEASRTFVKIMEMHCTEISRQKQKQLLLSCKSCRLIYQYG
ncbi:MAG: RusA family crossover junction endodeoxyribonuclease [Faecalispora jeddahensis]|jgi:Holliday junction resolvase RusA-like endonuclease|uniref:RusA family crossover junction endodeoxyribonuclease n=1 Tax=Eubacteriales TaxID=186802 RepID=UPI0009DB6430|nr:RusA family crossover junction endodeoxyribonuclease [Clostridium sp. MSTE9]MBS5782200.1 RusA family crossover junction endodeoxyribonuclease [Clostridium sp.]